jgi:hypothetical protein
VGTDAAIRGEPTLHEEMREDGGSLEAHPEKDRQATLTISLQEAVKRGFEGTNRVTHVPCLHHINCKEFGEER